MGNHCVRLSCEKCLRLCLSSVGKTGMTSSVLPGMRKGRWAYVLEVTRHSYMKHPALLHSMPGQSASDLSPFSPFSHLFPATCLLMSFSLVPLWSFVPFYEMALLFHISMTLHLLFSLPTMPTLAHVPSYLKDLIKVYLIEKPTVTSPIKELPIPPVPVIIYWFFFIIM